LNRFNSTKSPHMRKFRGEKEKEKGFSSRISFPGNGSKGDDLNHDCHFWQCTRDISYRMNAEGQENCTQPCKGKRNHSKKRCKVNHQESTERSLMREAYHVQRTTRKKKTPLLVKICRRLIHALLEARSVGPTTSTEMTTPTTIRMLLASPTGRRFRSQYAVQ
jgi:hypothetical protein